MAKNLVMGIDYGTDSVRALLVNADNGKEISSAVALYPRWAEGRFCSPRENRFRQHPLDYIESLEKAVKLCLKNAPEGSAKYVKGIGIDTTGSTPVAVNEEGLPLSLLKEFKSNPNAMFILWKDHTAVKEAEQINKLTKSWGGVDYTMYEGGIYSSEWFWAKICHILNTDEKVAKDAFSWVEHCDWLPALLTGETDPLKIKRSRCAAGHKAMWHSSWNGLPSEDFLIKLNPELKGLRNRLYSQTFTADTPAGTLSKEWAKRLGLSTDVVVVSGAFDAHMGAVGAGIKPGQLIKVIGTSTCDMLISSYDEIGNKIVPGICGQVDGSILPGYIGLEAGQSAFGDIYAWFANFISEGSKSLTKRENIIKRLTNEASKLKDPTIPLCLDWMNGRRTPDADQNLKGAIAGLSLGSTPAEVFKGLVEATCFGARAITERFISEKIEIKEVIATGGIAKKSFFVMQTLADVLQMPINVASSDQCCALGAAIFAATGAKLYKSAKDALEKMSSPIAKKYIPNKENSLVLNKRYLKYIKFAEFIERELKELWLKD